MEHLLVLKEGQVLTSKFSSPQWPPQDAGSQQRGGAQLEQCQTRQYPAIQVDCHFHRGLLASSQSPAQGAAERVGILVLQGQGLGLSHLRIPRKCLQTDRWTIGREMVHSGLVPSQRLGMQY